jgi:uncharacterized protein YciI
MKYVNHLHYIDDLKAVAKVRPTHRAYLAGLAERGNIVAARPFADSTGALFIYEADDEETAHRFAAQDPYSLGGVIRDQTIKQWELLYPNTALLERPIT